MRNSLLIVVSMLVALSATASTPVVAPGARVPTAQLANLGPGDPGTIGDRLIVRLGEGLATALEDHGFRARLQALIADSPYVEGRVALKRLLTVDEELRTALLGSISWQAAAAALPELELYFPATEHRGIWKGEAAVDVAVPLVDGLYRVFSPGGAVADIEGGVAPATPTLLLAASEIDYDDLESALVGGRRTGPYLERIAQGVARDQSAGSGSCAPAGEATRTAEGRATVTAAGTASDHDTFLTLLRVKRDYEGWPRGSMEIEVFGNIGGSFAACTRVTNVSEDRDYTFSLGTRRVSTAAPTDATTFDFKVYEDDDTGCSVRSGDDFVGEGKQTRSQFGIRHAYTNVDVTFQAKRDTVCGDFFCEAGENPFFCCECAFCGDSLCQTSCGENQFNCSFDCTCGNGFCDFFEDQFSCPFDCKCGNGFCDFGEDSFSCPQDCGF